MQHADFCSDINEVILMHCYVYLLSCRGGALYCGWTNDMPARLAAHKAGRGAKYTRSHAPVTLVYLETCEDKSAALRREIEIKRMPRQKKLALIEEHAARTAQLWHAAQEACGADVG